MVILDVKNLIKEFGEFRAVNNISFQMQEGEILGLLGPNGAGKTTTIHILLGVMEQSSGEIYYFGKSLKKNKEEILKRINFSSTYITMPWQFTVWEIMDVFARLYEIDDKKKRINKLLKEFEMEHLVKKQFHMLSAGEKTRLLLAKAFLNYPKLILLDEPTASMDPEIAIRIREFLKKEKNEYAVSILLTSHNMSEVEEMCDRVMVINHGKIIDEDTPENLAKKISRCTIELIITKDSKKVNNLFTKNDIPFEQNRYSFKLPIDEKDVAALLMLLANEKIEYQEISIDKPDLEDYFLQVIEGKKND